jgi:hypothetical protein
VPLRDFLINNLSQSRGGEILVKNRFSGIVDLRIENFSALLLLGTGKAISG